jgi:hypothetical protein
VCNNTIHSDIEEAHDTLRESHFQTAYLLQSGYPLAVDSGVPLLLLSAPAMHRQFVIPLHRPFVVASQVAIEECSAGF